MKKIFVIVMVAVCILGVSASVALADSPATGGLVKCGRTGTAQEQAQSCNFAALVNLINTLIKYLIFISMPLAAVAFAYAGWLYLSSGGNTGQVKKAREIFVNVGIGFILVLSAWLVFKWIDNTFLSPLYKDGVYLN